MLDEVTITKPITSNKPNGQNYQNIAPTNIHLFIKSVNVEDLTSFVKIFEVITAWITRRKKYITCTFFSMNKFK